MKNLLRNAARAALLCALLPHLAAYAQPENLNNSKFKQLDELLPTPNVYRTASGAPGHNYWQQRADYEIEVALDDEERKVTGYEEITYHNNSPDELKYLWLQLEQNIWDPESQTYKTETGGIREEMTFSEMERRVEQETFDGGYNITGVKNAEDGSDLSYTINYTMMRVDLPEPLKPGQKFRFTVAWNYLINNQRVLGGRTGWEYFPEDDNYLYEIAHWFPRMAVYSDKDGWQHKQFLGRGEFALPFGDYKVAITAPSDFVVAATGELQNAREMLTAEQRKRLDKASETYDYPVMIITEEEAIKNEQSRATDTKTWEFKAKNVRDFAWAASRKFLWDAMAVKQGGNNILCMSYYPKEGNPLWEKFSTQAVAHTIKVYSRFTFDYPYPVAISVNGPVYGMEYPMICFNGPRPEPDGTYSDLTKRRLISVIIHEVGHNYFPMIVNSDERQWTWMDEGMNSFVQFLAEREWSRDYQSRRGSPESMVPYMKGGHETMVPIMTNSESIPQFGNNAYGKPAAAFNILRETVMGRELFDHAFREYAQRWMFKHPAPADFFRTMEDASGVDLDWFWRGWFYTTDHVDIAVKDVKWYRLDTQNPDIENARRKQERADEPRTIYSIRNQEYVEQTLLEEKPKLEDFYDAYDPLDVTLVDRKRYERYLEQLTEEQKDMLEAGQHFYEIHFENVGGLVMPIILEFTYEDGTKEIRRIPAEIWRKNNEECSKVFVLDQPLLSVKLDPHLETADTDKSNNTFPRQAEPTRFELYKRREGSGINPMQLQRRIDEYKKNRDE